MPFGLCLKGVVHEHNLKTTLHTGIKGLDIILVQGCKDNFKRLSIVKRWIISCTLKKFHRCSKSTKTIVNLDCVLDLIYLNTENM